jgi:hypothetical protein
MTKAPVTPDQARAVARELFTQLYHDQGEWFDLAWDRCCVPGVNVDRQTPLTELPGLGAVGKADSLTQSMARQFADLAATFLIHLPAARSELLAKLRRHQAQSGKPDAIIDWLVESATQTLEQLSSANKVFVSTLSKKGQMKANRCRDYEEAEEDLNSQEFDIIVHEPKHEVRVSDSDGILPSRITNVTPMRRGMLWLVLTSVGGFLKHENIATLFHVDVTERSPNEPDKDRVVNKVYQYPVALRETLGRKLYGRVVQKGSGRGNAVMREGWSFIWIRKTANERDSELLHGIVGPARIPK